MQFTSATLGLVPHFEVTVYIVFDDFGKAGWIYPETDDREANLDSVVDDLLTGQLQNPVRVVAFNTSEGWSRESCGEVVRAFEAKLEIRDGATIWTTRKLEDVNRARVQALLDDGLSVRDIADETGIPKSTVQRIKKAIELTKGNGNAA